MTLPIGDCEVAAFVPGENVMDSGVLRLMSTGRLELSVVA